MPLNFLEDEDQEKVAGIKEIEKKLIEEVQTPKEVRLKDKA